MQVLAVAGAAQSNMIIFLYGSDTYRSQIQLQKMKDKFSSERDPAGMNVVVADCSDGAEASTRELMLTSPFLAEKRMVIIRNVFDCSKEMTKWFEQQYEGMSLREDTVYVFYTDKDVVKKSTLFKRLVEEKFAQQFAAPKGKDLENWIVRLVQNLGGSIDQQSVSLLVSSCEGDVWKCANRVHQLVMYVGDRMITVADTQLFVETKVEDAIFPLMDAITRQDAGQALSLLQQQWSYGSEPMQVFGMVVRQYRIMGDILSVQSANPNADQRSIADTLGIHPFVVKKTLPMLRNYSLSDIARGQSTLLAMDRKIKTGAAQMNELLDWLVVR